MDVCALVIVWRCDCLCDTSVEDSVQSRWHLSAIPGVNVSLNVSLNANLHTA